MKRHNETHVLALDVRHSRIGYALFSGPKRLLDRGASTVPPQCNDRAGWIRQRMTSLLQQGSPSFIVMKQRRRARPTGNAAGVPILNAIRLAAKEHGIPMYVLGREEIESVFNVFHARTKEQIARAVVGIFPELLGRLPPTRKKWQPEARGMIVFDAIATGVAYWQRSSFRI